MLLTATLRSLTRARALSLTVVVTVAIGVSAVVIAFGVVNAAIFRQPPFDEAGRVALLFLQRNPQGEAPYRERWSFARFEMLRDLQKSFEHVASYSPTSLSVSGGADVELISGERVSASYFQVLRTGESILRVKRPSSA